MNNISRKPSVNIISLGCSKNLVDSERLMLLLEEAGFEVKFESDEPSDAVVVNTCGFIGDAKEESVETIMNFVGAKESGLVKCLYVMGCLAERYRMDLEKEIPEVDGLYGKFDWAAIVDDLRLRFPSASDTAPVQKSYGRKVTTSPANAYIKIAEGCNRFCAFCAIPLITGRFKSRPIEEIEAEVKALVEQGYSEFNIIAQDLSSYGIDLYGKLALSGLVTRLSDIPGVHWLRLHYAYPAQFPYDILPVMREKQNVCAYLDIALQHIDDGVLTNMRRHIDGDQTRELLARIRREVPGIHIRTTLMVGFPGETEKAFDELMQFVKEQRFERMGAFAYSEEEGTYGAAHFTDSIPEEVKQNRLDRLMALQEEISMEIQQQKIGREIEVVIDNEESDYYIARSQWDSPEVDPQVLVRKTKTLKPGQYYKVRIVDALPFELIAEPIS